MDAKIQPCHDFFRHCNPKLEPPVGTHMSPTHWVKGWAFVHDRKPVPCERGCGPQGVWRQGCSNQSKLAG
eukprot:1158349-Pelagomonas_calceolata.AAC.3